MQGPASKSNGNGSDYAKATSDEYRRFTTEEITQVKMMDLRELMKGIGVRLSWVKDHYEGKCPFHDDPIRAPRLLANQDKGIWLWRCEGGHHTGTTIDFMKFSEGLSFPKAMNKLQSQVVDVPKLNGKGRTIGEIVGPMLENQAEGGGWKVEGKDEIATATHRNDSASPSTIDLQPSTLVERSDDSATFKYGELIYQAKGLKGASTTSLKIILKLIHKDGYFTDRVDLHSARGRKSFANQAADRLNLQSAQVEEHLENLMEELETVTGSQLPVASNKEEMNEKEKEEALALLKDPNLLDRMAQDLDKLGYVGEAINKKILYLVSTSRLLDKPISAIVRSGSGAGKSALIEQILSLMPEEDVLFFSRITPQSLFYMGKEALDRKILAIDEREGSQEADYSIRTLQSRGKLTLAASQKDPKTGEWKTFVHEFAARTPYMESSTKEKINEENLNRSFELYLDESPEQTKRVQEAQKKMAARIDQMSDHQKSKLKVLYQNAQRLLEPLEVRIPYELSIDMPSQWLRTRRDHERILSLVKVIALVHQHQRTLKNDEQGKFLEATSKDYEIAKDLSRHLMGHLFNDMSQPLMEFYTLLKGKVQEKTQGLPIEDFAFTRRQVREWLSLPDHVVKRHMKALQELEYLHVKGSTRGSRHFYWLTDCLPSGINTDQNPKVEQRGKGSKAA